MPCQPEQLSEVIGHGLSTCTEVIGHVLSTCTTSFLRVEMKEPHICGPKDLKSFRRCPHEF